jgi:hypothetical protein
VPFRRNVPALFRRNVPALFRGGERAYLFDLLKNNSGRIHAAAGTLNNEGALDENAGTVGICLFLLFPKNKQLCPQGDNYSGKSWHVSVGPSRCTSGALVPAEGPRSAAEGAAQRSGTSSPIGDIIPMSFRDIVPVRGYYPDVFSGHPPRRVGGGHVNGRPKRSPLQNWPMGRRSEFASR